MIKVCSVIIFLLSGLASFSQAAKVNSQQQRVKGDNVDGFAIDLEGKKAEVTASLTKYLKEIGKLKLLSSDPLVVTDPLFNGLVYTKKSIYALTSESGNMTTAWLGIKPTEWESKDINFINKQVERLAGEFGVRFQRERMQAQIDETLQAAEAVEKQAVRFLNQGKDLQTKFVNNELEKARQDKALETNKLENAVLKIKIENNKKAQDSIANAAVQINKVREAQLEKLRKIN